MGVPLRVLLLEDRPTDAELVLGALRQAGFESVARRVDTEADYLAGLDPALDVVLADYNLPQFDAPRALRLLQERGLDVPFIVVSGMIGEERAVSMVKEGAADYLLKDRLARLGPAVAAALEKTRQRRALRDLAEIGRALSRSLDVEVVGNRIVTSVRALLHTQASALYWIEPESGDLIRVARSSDLGAEPDGIPVIPGGSGLTGLAVRDRSPMMTADLLADPRVTYLAELRAFLERTGLRSALAVPLTANDVVVGVLVVVDREPRAFGPWEIELAQSFADQAAVALENALLYRRAEARARNLTTLSMLSQLITSSYDRSVVFDAIARGAITLLGAKVVHLWVADPSHQVLRVQGSFGMDPGLARRLLDFDAVPYGQGILGRIFEARVPEHIADCQDDPRWLNERFIRELDLHGYAGLPLIGGGRAAGVLSILFAERRQFTAEETELMGLLADHAAIAVQNAQFVEELRGRQGRLEALLQVSRELSRIQPVDALLGKIAEACGRLLAADVVRVFVEDGGELSVSGSWGEPTEALLPRSRRSIGEGLVGTVAATGRPLVVADLLSDPRVIPEHREAARSGGYRAWLGVPIVIGERLAGVLSVLRRQPVFSPQDVEIVTAFASQAAVALENARLYAETLRTHEDLSRTQRQLLQAQKMESIGRLAGGIAHDFNNLLTVILGRTQILRNDTAPDSDRRQIELIESAAERAAGLVRQLLVFSRTRQIERRTLDLNAVVTTIAPLLRRLIGEDVEIVTTLDEGLPPVRGDLGQLEQVIINLAVNARAAMPAGGRLGIQTASVEIGASEAGAGRPVPPGSYVMLAVSDTGVGMGPEVLEHLFEPFFTTKEPGRGTGLGLSIVYGIVKQHQGTIEVDSEVTRGSTFRIYLPPDHAGVALTEAPPVSAAAPRGSETILLVEDEADVRSLARESLQLAGYTVLEAASPEDALATWPRESGRIDLLLTDVVMPHMSGRELAERLRRACPDLRVLYMSGYTPDALDQHDLGGQAAALLQKPFTPHSLARRVREVLDGTPSAG